ncbi:MAG TPA: alanine racemase, partial [Tepidisphaeraceae bacterium]|nr:alanine racemase [Tepidisphaeraceae bacterium]
SIVIDADVVRRNVRKLAAYAKQHSIALRPHAKTHKSTLLAGIQREAGAIGLTVAKVGEAQVMAEAADDLLMAYPAVDPFRCGELARLALRKTVRVAIDSVEAADHLAEAARTAGSTISLLVDLDVGFHRTGVQTPAAALALAEHASRLKGVRVDGLFFYPGHVKDDRAESVAQLKGIDSLVGEAVVLFKTAGISTAILSGGTTPTAYASHHIRNQTEIRPGTYVFYDMNGVRGGYATVDDCAARVHATVVSTAVPDQFVIDAGTKTLTSDKCGPAPDSGHGLILEYPDAKIVKLTEEHGQVDVTGSAKRPKVGERVTIIPNHICPCVNLQNQVWWREAGEVRPINVDARGRVV